jgi:hypothetical protein
MGFLKSIGSVQAFVHRPRIDDGISAEMPKCLPSDHPPAKLTGGSSVAR